MKIEVKTSLGTIVVTPSIDPENPGVYIDLAREGHPPMSLALVEATCDEADQEGKCKMITRVWGDAEDEDYTDRVVHRGIENWFSDDEEVR